eukprot:364613-Chlamydomonas_euryale.AAC.9
MCGCVDVWICGTSGQALASSSCWCCRSFEPGAAWQSQMCGCLDIWDLGAGLGKQQRLVLPPPLNKV